MKKYLFALFIFSLLTNALNAQTPMWAFKMGSPAATAGNDCGYSCQVAPNGNIVVGGRFSGTMDIDPGVGVTNITSNGLLDMFLACYTPAGALVWGFGIGGINNDVIYKVAVDASSNVAICGFFQTSADFDPGPGVATVISSGGVGSTTEGEGFVAKYSSTGVFQWAKALGGPSVYDYTEGLIFDEVGNLYVGGEFGGSMTISGSITFISSNGPAYLIKYSPSGTIIWAHSFGEFGPGPLGTTPRDLRVRNGFLYVGGEFKGTANFQPWGTPAIVSAPGGSGDVSGYIAKYDTAGNFVFVQAINGAGYDDEVGSIELDAVGNIYVGGFTQSSSLVFNAASPGTSTVTGPVGGAGYDFFLAKYSNSGVYQWGHITGSAGPDFARSGIDISGSYLYAPGWFSNTVDFDPSASIANMTSAGNTDFYLCKYDLNGNYLCGFRVGAAGIDDYAYASSCDAVGNVYITGQFGGTATDFDPGAPVYPLTSSGGSDIFLAKYNFGGSTTYTGTWVGDTICVGDTAYLTVTMTTGPIGPYIITFTNGTSTFTVSGVNSGTPFAVLPSPTMTTTYTILSATYVGIGPTCNPPATIIFGSATIVVNPLPVPIAGSIPFCVGSTITLTNLTTGGVWSCAPSTVATISSTGVVTGVGPGTATVSYTTVCGIATVVVTVSISPGIITGNVPLCPGSTITLTNTFSGGTWSCAPSSVATISSTGVVTGIGVGTATVSYITTCGSSTAVVTVNQAPSITGISFINPTCTDANGSITLSSFTAGATYTVHYTGTSVITTPITANALGNIIITGLTAGTYTTISVTNFFGCSSNVIGPVTLTGIGLPEAPTAAANSPCEGDTLKLSAVASVGGATYNWTGPSGFTATTDNPYIYPANVSHSGTYSVTITQGPCTSVVTTVLATVNPQPVIKGITSNGPGSCYGSDGWITLEGLVAGETYTVDYLFNGVPVSVTLTASSAGKLLVSGLSSGSYYGFVVTSSFGCQSIAVGPVMLEFSGKPPKPIIEHNNPCIGHTLFLSATDAMPGGTYTWAYPDGGSSSLQNNVRYEVPLSVGGVYTVTYTVNGCATSDTATVALYTPVILINVTPDQTIPYGSSIQLNANGATFYSWVPNDGSLDNNSINNPVTTPQDSITYTVYGTNNGGCMDSAKVTIRIDDDIEEFIPSAFTPNGDGLNDLFRIRNMRTQKLIEFSIYNRYGERVYFNSYQKDAGWDGTYNGVKQDIGVYFYYVIVGLRDGATRVHKGDVTLIR